MDTNSLIDVVMTRINGDDGNPTRLSFLYELVSALNRLKEYEGQDNTIDYSNEIEDID